MSKKRNFIFLSLLILGILLLTSCFLKPPVTEGVLKGQVIVPEGSVQTKDLTGQALPDATVNIIDPATGDIIATTTTDANGYYQVFVPAGGPYLLQVVKDGVVVLQITPQVEVGIEYDLGTADCSTTAVALIALAMMDAGADLADINLADIEADPNFDDVLSNVTSIIEAGGDPTESAVIQQAVEDFLYPPTPAPTPPPPTYTVTYNGNTNTGGTVPSDANNYEQGDSVTVLDKGTLVKTGYTFDGWNTAADGNGIDQAEGSTFAMGASDVTLYAKWLQNFTITFDKNDTSATGTMADQTIASGSSANLTACAFTKTGWTFAGWAETTDGAVVYADNASYTMGTANVILYAKWTINTYTVTYDGNGNTGGTAPVDSSSPYEYLATVTVLNEGDLVKADHVFDGWNTQADGNGVNRAPGSTFNMGSENVTLYAKWTIDRYVSKSGDDGDDGSADYPWLTIQHALDNTPGGGTVHVADGTYTEKITFPSTLDTDGGRVIVLKSENGAESTKINEIYQSGGFIVTLDSCPDGTTLDGFTITTEAVNKSTGGIFIKYCSPTIQNNTISGNAATRGGGIYIYICSPTIQNNTISGNTASGDGGGGIFIHYSSPTIQNNTISGNTTPNRGGGIYIDHSSPIIQNNTISENISSNRGGGIYIHYGLPIIQNNTISENISTNCGGGIYSGHSSLTIQDNTISFNIATYEGGGISISGSATIKNNTISDNSVEKGGGISISGSATIKNNTILRNTASGNNILGGGGGIYISLGSPNIQDNTILENTAYYGGGIYISNSSASDSPTIQNNTISGNTTSDDGGGIYIFSTSGLPTIGGASDTDTANFNAVCGNTPLPQINPDTYPNNYIFTNCDVIGETGPAGGLIFYDKGEVSDGWRYMEAAPGDQSASAEWGCIGTLTGADGSAVGTGKQNTIDILGGCAEDGIAARLCNVLVEGDYNDWFLPSKAELNLMYANLHNIGTPVGGFESGLYWSSSEREGNAHNAWTQDFSNSDQNYYLKYSELRVRAIRAF